MVGFEEDLRMCTLKDRDRFFEESVRLEKNFARHVCKNGQAFLFMKVNRDFEALKKRKAKPKKKICCGFDPFKIYIR